MMLTQCETPFPQNRDFHESVLRYRKRFSTDAVRLHHLPRWWKRRVKQAGGEIYAYSYGLGEDIFDHCGSSRNGTVFVSEPYGSHDDPQLIASVGRVAIRLGLEYVILPACRSWWNPPSTCRIEFWEPSFQLGHFDPIDFLMRAGFQHPNHRTRKNRRERPWCWHRRWELNEWRFRRAMEQRLDPGN